MRKPPLWKWAELEVSCHKDFRVGPPNSVRVRVTETLQRVKLAARVPLLGSISFHSGGPQKGNPGTLSVEDSGRG